MFEINSKQFSGPIEKLLGLIEEKQLDITEVSLAAVTADFIEYVKSLETSIDPKSLSDFVVVASRLVLIKSKVLLPGLELTTEEQIEIRDLEKRLELYREFKQAGAALKSLSASGKYSYSREFLHNIPSFFYPSKNLSIGSLNDAIKRLFQTLEEFMPKDEKTVKKVLVTIEEKMTELLGRLESSGKESFKHLAKGKTRGEIVALFLAVLHLLKHQRVNIEQSGQFDDIIISS